MRALLTLLTIFISADIAHAEDLEQRAKQYAEFTGRSYEACSYFLKLGTWCKANPQGGVFGRTVYDAKLCAETLAKVTATLQTPASEEERRQKVAAQEVDLLSQTTSAVTTSSRPKEVEEDKQSQQKLAVQYAKATGRTPAECLQAVQMIEWCTVNRDGGTIQSKRFEATDVAAMQKQAQEFLTTPARPSSGQLPSYATTTVPYSLPSATPRIDASVAGSPSTMLNTYQMGAGSMTYASDGTMYNTYRMGNTSTTYASDGTMYNTYRMGNTSTTYGSDGTMYNTYRMGNTSTTYGSDGAMYNTYRMGNTSTTYGSDGTMYNTYRTGNTSTTYGSDGAMFNTYSTGSGSMTFGY